MMDKEIEPLDAGPDAPVLLIEEMEKRLEAQIIGMCDDGDPLCIWYACTDVCPPGG